MYFLANIAQTVKDLLDAMRLGVAGTVGKITPHLSVFCRSGEGLLLPALNPLWEEDFIREARPGSANRMARLFSFLLLLLFF